MYKITDKYMKHVSIKVNGEEQVSGLSESGAYAISSRITQIVHYLYVVFPGSQFKGTIILYFRPCSA